MPEPNIICRGGAVACPAPSPFPDVGANVGTGAGEVYRDKTANVLNFRKIKAGANVGVALVGDDIVVSASAPAPAPKSYGMIRGYNGSVNLAAWPTYLQLNPTGSTVVATPAPVDFDSPSNGQLRYTGAATKKFLVTGGVTVRCGSALPSIVAYFQIAQGAGAANNPTDLYKTVVIPDYNTIALAGIFQLSQNNILFIAVAEGSGGSGDNLACERFNIAAVEIE